MAYTTVGFLAFLMGTAFIYRVCPARLRPALLAVVSYLYYCLWSLEGALLLLAVTASSFAAAHAIEAAKNERRRQAFMFAALSGLVLLLAAFKLMPFIGEILKFSPWVPIGLSYYTFKLISYVLDVYWGTVTAEKSFVSFAAYAAFFPQIVAGPIQRSGGFLQQLQQSSPATAADMAWGLQRILLGFLKKFLVADILGVPVDFVYGNLHATGTPLLLGFYAFPIQLYADFSALSDIAIGSAAMLGIKSPENFSAPFSAPSPSEFWRRWHMTLTSLLTDYVFTPLQMGLRSLGTIGLVISVFATMELIGLWHGLRWTYVLFGTVQGCYVAIDALTLRARKRYYKAHPAVQRLTVWVGPLLTFHLIAASFVLFRAESVADAFYLLGHLGSGITTQSVAFSALMAKEFNAIVFAAVAYVVIELVEYLQRRGRGAALISDMRPWARWIVYSCATVTVSSMILLLVGTQVRHVTFVYQMF